MRVSLIKAGAILAGLLCAAPSSAGTAPCRVQPVADFGNAPAQWLGACPAGRADGLGVIRSGRAEPYKFFSGEVRAGRPVRGLLITEDGWFAAASFDADGRRRDITSGDPNAYHALYVLAARSASASAQRFAAAGNRASATYYQRLAKKIADGEPE
jgi:hypothetical protein